MLDAILQALRDYETTISSIVGLLTLCAALWGAFRLTFRVRNRNPEQRGAISRADRPPSRSRGWGAIMNLGLGRHSRLEELVSVRTVNVAFLCLGAVSLPWLFFSITSADTVVLAGIALFAVIAVLVGFSLQWSGRTGAARWLLVVAVACYWLGVMLAVGPMGGTEYFLAALLVVPVLIFSRAERGQMLLAMLLACVVFVAGVLLSRSQPPLMPISEQLWLFGYHINAVFLAAILFASVSYYRSFASSSYHELESQKKQNDALVSSLLPERVARQIEEHKGSMAEWHPEATVIYASLTGLSQLYTRMSAIELVNRLGVIYAHFDRIALREGVEKVKTLGTTYVAATGIGSGGSAPGAAATCALAMRDALDSFAAEHQLPLSFRCGIATGLAISGVIADARPRFDIWGEALEAAARAHQSAGAGEICIDESAFWRLKDSFALSAHEQDTRLHRLLGEASDSEQSARVS